MISEILKHPKLDEVLPWVTPVIQGFVQIDRLAIQVDSSVSSPNNNVQQINDTQ